MNTEQEKLRASIEALEQMLGLVGKQNDTDANWARYLLSIANKQPRLGTNSHSARFSPQLLSIKKETRPSAYNGPERRTESSRRKYSNRFLTSQNSSRSHCRRVNRDRRRKNLSGKFIDLP